MNKDFNIYHCAKDLATELLDWLQGSTTAEEFDELPIDEETTTLQELYQTCRDRDNYDFEYCYSFYTYDLLRALADCWELFDHFAELYGTDAGINLDNVLVLNYCIEEEAVQQFGDETIQELTKE